MYSFNIKSVFFKYLSSSIVASAIGVFSGFFTYRYIEPDKLGIWALFTVVEVYATITRLGIINGLGRELPYLLGKNDVSRAESYASTALFYSLGSNLFLFLLVPLLFAFKAFTLYNEYYLFSLLVILFRLLFSSYTSYLSVTFRTSKNFNDLSNIQNILTVLRVLSILLVVLYGFWGLLIREFIVNFFEMMLFHYKRPMKVLPRFNKNHLVNLFKVGFPLFLVSYAVSFIDTIPRLFLVTYGSVNQLGLFSPIVIMLGAALLIPNAISSYMYPKMSFEYGQNNDKKGLWRIVKLTAMASFASGFLIFILVFSLADYIEFILPKYAEIIPYLKIASFSLLFIGYKAAGLSFSVLKSWKIMYINTIFNLLITIISIVVLKFYLDDVLMITVISMLLTYGLMFIISVFLSFKVTHQ